MSKVYEVTIPSHSGGGKYRITAKNETRVKEMICEKLGRDRVPKGTIINKIGLSKVSKESSENKTEPPVEPQEQEDSLKKRSIKNIDVNEKKKVKLVKDLKPYEKKVYIEQKKEEKEQKEQENCYYLDGLYLKYENQVKLKSKMDFHDAVLYYVEEDGKVCFCYVGEESILSLKRGTKLWLYIDYTKDKVNEKELLNHI